jgi:hypothetical protein
MEGTAANGRNKTMISGRISDVQTQENVMNGGISGLQTHETVLEGSVVSSRLAQWPSYEV